MDIIVFAVDSAVLHAVAGADAPRALLTQKCQPLHALYTRYAQQLCTPMRTLCAVYCYLYMLCVQCVWVALNIRSSQAATCA